MDLDPALTLELLLQTELFRRQMGVGLMTGAGVFAIVKTAAERGRLGGSSVRLLNASIAFSSALFAVPWMHAHSVGVPVRAVVFWPVAALMLASLVINGLLAGVRQ